MSWKIFVIGLLSITITTRIFAEISINKISDSKVEVTFYFKNKGYSNVFLAGSINDWSAQKNPMVLGKNGYWAMTSQFSINQVISWKYVADGKWLTDQFAPELVDDGFNGKNASLNILAYLASGKKQEIPDIGVYPVPEKDVVERRKKILEYISALSSDTFKGVISGQNCYHGDEITASHWLNGYENLVTALQAETGKWVGLVGLDYEYMRIYTPQELSRANTILIDHARQGGMVTICLTPQNPWTNDESKPSGLPPSDTGKGSTRDLSGVTSLDDLIDPTKPVYASWMHKLDRIAAALQELKDAGVIVLWRPMQEMNGNWFWWGMSSHPNDPQPYIRLYRHMHDYFTNTKKLSNLLWVYSPNSSLGQGLDSSWNRPIAWAYPGSDVVDIVAGTVYSDNLDIKDYKAYKALGKPMGMAEYSPEDSGLAKNGLLDTRLYLKRIKKDYPRIAYWVSWHQYESAFWSLIGNKNAVELLNDPGVKTRDDLPKF